MTSPARRPLPPPTPHPALVDRALTGDSDAVDQLVRVWLPQVYRWCQRLGGPRIDTEGAAHEVLMTVCRKISGVREPERFPAWLYGICKRVVANHRRRAWLRSWVGAPTGEVADPRQDPHAEAEQTQAAQRVWQTLEQLTSAQREVLVLCELEERTSAEAAEAAELIGIPVGTVKSRLRLARIAFKNHYECQRSAAPGERTAWTSSNT